LCARFSSLAAKGETGRAKSSMGPRSNRYRTYLNNNNPPISTNNGTQKCTSVSTLLSQFRVSSLLGFPLLGVTVIVGAIISLRPCFTTTVNTPGLLQALRFALTPRSRYSP
jgi:hypothetical protein